VSALNKGATAGAIEACYNMGKAGTPLVPSYDNVIEIITMMGSVLDEQNIPEDDRWAVLPVWMTQKIKNSELKDASMTGDPKSILRNGGRIGMVDRFNIYQSNLLARTLDGGSGKMCTNVVFGHRSAITFATQMTQNEIIDNPNDYGKLYRGLQVYGYKVVQPTAIGHALVSRT